MDKDLDNNKRKRQEIMADSTTTSLTHPILKPAVNLPTGITKNSEEHVALTSQIDEVVNLCKTFF